MPSRKRRIERYVPLVKVDSEERLVYGIVLEPDTVDIQGDWVTSDEIKKACWGFMEKYQQLDVEHNLSVNSKIAVRECFIAPTDFDLDGDIVKKGSWVLATGIYDDTVWSRVQKGEITGYSIYGHGIDNG